MPLPYGGGGIITTDNGNSFAGTITPEQLTVYLYFAMQSNSIQIKLPEKMFCWHENFELIHQKLLTNT